MLTVQSHNIHTICGYASAVFWHVVNTSANTMAYAMTYTMIHTMAYSETNLMGDSLRF